MDLQKLEEWADDVTRNGIKQQIDNKQTNNKTFTAVVPSIYGLVPWTSTFESRAKTAGRVAIFRFAICVCDVMNKVGMYDRTVYCVTSKLVSVLDW